MALSHISLMGIITNCTIIPLGLKVGVGEACEVKVRDVSAVFPGKCSCTVICWGKNLKLKHDITKLFPDKIVFYMRTTHTIR